MWQQTAAPATLTTTATTITTSASWRPPRSCTSASTATRAGAGSPFDKTLPGFSRAACTQVVVMTSTPLHNPTPNRTCKAPSGTKTLAYPTAPSPIATLECGPNPAETTISAWLVSHLVTLLYATKDATLYLVTHYINRSNTPHVFHITHQTSPRSTTPLQHHTTITLHHHITTPPHHHRGLGGGHMEDKPKHGRQARVAGSHSTTTAASSPLPTAAATTVEFC